MSETLSQSELKECLERAAVTGLYSYPIKSCGANVLEAAHVVETGFAHDREFMFIDPETGKFHSQRNLPLLATILPHIADDSLSVVAPGMEQLDIAIQREGDPRGALVQRDAVQVVDQGDEISQWFGDYTGVAGRLVRMAPNFTRQVNQEWALNPDDEVNFADGYPILLISTESLDDLNARLPGEVSMNAFRPNVVIQGSGIPYGEDAMRVLTIGDVTMDVVKPCSRCVITTTDQVTGTLIRDSEHPMFGEPLLTLGKYRLLEYGNAGKHGVLFGQNLVQRQSGGTIHMGDRVQAVQLR